MKARYLKTPVREDLANKMVLLGGPRQVGKTTFAVALLRPATTRNPGYLNWDNPQHRSRLLRGELPPRQRLIVLDEIHKFARWRNLIKGFYCVVH